MDLEARCSGAALPPATALDELAKAAGAEMKWLVACRNPSPITAVGSGNPGLPWKTKTETTDSPVWNKHPAQEIHSLNILTT